MMHRHLMTCVAVAGLLVISTMVYAGTQAKIEGRVMDLAGTPIAGATVTITTTEVSTFKKVITTDEDGEFQTLILDATRGYSFLVEAEGFQPEESPFKVGAGSTDNFFEFSLQSEEQAAAARGIKQLEQPGYKELEEAKELMAAGDTVAARAKFEAAIAARPDLLEAYVRVAELAYDMGDMEGALTAAARGIKQLEQPGYKELEEARELMAAGDTVAARAKFEEAIAARPELLEAYVRVAELAYDMGDMEGALTAARGCLDEAPESIQCLAIAINASGELGDEATRSEYLARYQKLNPDDPTILFNEAAVFLNNLDDEGARPLLERCLDADPNFPECNFEYGMLLLRSGDMEGAKERLQRYLENAPDGPLASTAEETIKYL